MEDRVHVRFVEAVEPGVQVREWWAWHAGGWDPRGAKVPKRAVGLDEAHHRELLGHAGLAFGRAARAVLPPVVLREEPADLLGRAARPGESAPFHRAKSRRHSSGTEAGWASSARRDPR